MKNSDIRPLGGGDGIGYFWIKQGGTLGNYLALVAINEVGEVTRTGLAAKYDEAALSEQEAVVEHLAGGLSQADADLERRRKDAPDPKPKPAPIDPATARFFNDDAVPLESE